MIDERAEVAARLREAREYLGISQQEVATLTGLPRSAVSLIETGQRRVDTVELKTFAKLYQRPITFFTGENESALSSEVALLARQASKLSQQDRGELLRFSEFLMQRSQEGSRDDNAP